MQILIVDDNVELVEILADILSGEGFKVQVCSGTELEILRSIEESSPDCILLDHNMLDTTGLAIAKKLRSNPKHSHRELGIMSGDISPALRLEARGLGITMLVQKPFAFADLIAQFRAKRDVLYYANAA